MEKNRVDFVFTYNDIKKVPSQIKRLFSKLKNKRSGYILIMFVVYMFVISLLAIMDPMLSSALNLKQAWTRTAVNRAQTLAFSTPSPIQDRIVDEVYKRIQAQLIDHIAKSKGSTPYECQGVTVQPESLDPQSGSLKNQFGLCQPERLLEGLNGLNNQTIDYLPAIFPNYKFPLTGENEVARQAIVKQNTNNYSYSLTNTFVGQNVVDNPRARDFRNVTGVARQEYYQWLVNAYIEASLPEWRNTTRGVIANFDVTVSSNYNPSNFGGGGNNCDRNEGLPDAKCPVDIDELGICNPISYTDQNGVEWMGGSGPCPGGFGGPLIADQCEQNGPCEDHGPVITCPLAGGGTVTKVKVRFARPHFGCASLSTGRAGKVIDPQGYTFTLTVKLVSIRNTYN